MRRLSKQARSSLSEASLGRGKHRRQQKAQWRREQTHVGLAELNSRSLLRVLGCDVIMPFRLCHESLMTCPLHSQVLVW